VSSAITVQLDSATTARLQLLAASRDKTPEALLHEALTQYLDREKATSADHSQGKSYPVRHRVGGIITPA